MSYTATNWQTGDVITAEKLNHIEGGIESAGQVDTGDAVVINASLSGQNVVFDKTYAELLPLAYDGDMFYVKYPEGGSYEGFYYSTVVGEQESIGLDASNPQFLTEREGAGSALIIEVKTFFVTSDGVVTQGSQTYTLNSD